METRKISVSIQSDMIDFIDRCVKERFFPNRSRAISASIKVAEEKWRKVRLRYAVSRMNKKEEQKLANEFLIGESWPEF